MPGCLSLCVIHCDGLVGLALTLTVKKMDSYIKWQVINCINYFLYMFTIFIINTI